MPHQSRKLSRFTTIALLLLAVIGLLGALPVPSASAAEEETSYLGVGISPTIRKLELHSGDQQTVQMTVRNRTKFTENLKLYAAPYNILDSDYSQPDYDQQTHYSHLAKWITFDQTEYTVNPEAEIAVEFHINVPDSVPDGTQYATVFAETTGYSDGEQTIGVRAYGRVGMVVKAKMLDGKNIESAEVTSHKIPRFQPDSPLQTSFVIENSGNVEYETQSRIVVRDFFGNKEKYKSTWHSTSVYPESRRSVAIDWEQSKPGIYKVSQEIKTMKGQTIEYHATVLAIPLWIMLLFILGIIIIIANIVLIIMRRKPGGRRHVRRHID